MDSFLRSRITGGEGAKTAREGRFYSFQADTEGGIRLKRIFGALPRALLKKLFGKSFFRIFKSFLSVIVFQ